MWSKGVTIVKETTVTGMIEKEATVRVTVARRASTRKNLMRTPNSLLPEVRYT